MRYLRLIVLATILSSVGCGRPEPSSELSPNDIAASTRSMGAAMHGFPGAGAYGATEAALRLAGMALGAELDMRDTAGSPRDATIYSYDPGVVATAAQDTLRATAAEVLPIVGLFQQLADEGRLLSPSVPAEAIVAHVQADGHPHFSEHHATMG